MSPKRLLVVDDEEHFAAFVRDAAEDLGFAVEVCGDGRTAQKLFEKHRPDVIVLDVVMPESDGIEFLRWLAERGARARVIMVSGYDARFADMAARIGESHGLADLAVLTKPVRLPELRAALKNQAARTA